MVEKWLKEDNYITTPSLAIKWIRNNQFSLSSAELFLLFAAKKNVFKTFYCKRY